MRSQDMKLTTPNEIAASQRASRIAENDGVDRSIGRRSSGRRWTGNMTSKGPRPIIISDDRQHFLLEHQSTVPEDRSMWRLRALSENRSQSDESGANRR
jgi:hypothetical protein